jgi:hypothetical protein
MRRQVPPVIPNAEPPYLSVETHRMMVADKPRPHGWIGDQCRGG